jgi:hypothetical protein
MIVSYSGVFGRTNQCKKGRKLNRLVNAIKLHSNSLDSRRGEARFGTIASVDPSKALARVNIQPGGVLTGWLPVLSPWIGSSWGMTCPLSAGDQVFVIPQEGDADHGVVIGGIYSNVQQTPIAQPGELWLVHRTGSSIRLCNDGTIQIAGNLHVQGEVFDRLGPMSLIRTTLNSHTHLDSRGGQTSVSNQQI